MIPNPDAFDLGAAAVWEARAKGEKLFKTDLARIFRTTYQAFQVNHPSKEANPPKKKRACRARSPLFDALAEATGSDPDNVTKAGGKAVGEALADILEVSPQTTPEHIRVAADKYKRIHKDWALTARSLAKYWADCAPIHSEETKASRSDPYIEPKVWKPTALRMYPGTEVSDMEWLQIPITLRSDILRQIP